MKFSGTSGSFWRYPIISCLALSSIRLHTHTHTLFSHHALGSLNWRSQKSRIQGRFNFCSTMQWDTGHGAVSQKNRWPMTGHDNVFNQRDCKVKVLTISQEARGGCECKHSSSSSSSVLGSFPWVWCSFMILMQWWSGTYEGVYVHVTVSVSFLI